MQDPRCPAAVKGTNVHCAMRKKPLGNWEGGQVGRPEPEHRSIRKLRGRHLMYHHQQSASDIFPSSITITSPIKKLR